MSGSINASHHALHTNALACRLITRLSGRYGLLNQSVEATDGPRVMIDGEWVLNFTSSDYLGLATNPSIREFTSDTVQSLGISHSSPRILSSDGLTTQLEDALAELVHREAVLLFPSTLHAAIDVLAMLTAGQRHILIDERAYPISVSAARLASRHRGRLLRFRHNEPGSLERLLVGPPKINNAIIVCDGVYAESGRPASLRQIAEIASRAGATVFVDDAHGLGLLGINPTSNMPYGLGGGGTVLHTGARPDSIVYVSSLSKALGVPLAFAAGSTTFIRKLQTTSASVVHSSPPAIPVVAGALATLEVHRRHGDALRRGLLARVRYFRSNVASLGLPPTTDGEFPVQTIRFPSAERAIATGLALRRHGIWPVISLGSGSPAALRFVITASHSRDDLDLAIRALETYARSSTP